jgi:hypothetical protein
MSITSKIRIARGLKSGLPVPPNSFEQGRPYFAEDTQELFVGQGISLPMLKVGFTPAAQLTFVGDWNNSTDYILNDLVTDNNTLYICLNPNSNEVPNSFPLDWAVVVSGSSVSGAFYQFTQSTPLATWVVLHNLNKYPSVVIEDSSGETVLGDVHYDNLNQCTLSFSGAFSGIATFN